MGVQTEHLAQRVGQVDIITDRGLAVFLEEFRRSVRELHTDGELAVLGHRIGQHGGDGRILLDAGDIIAGGGRTR